MSYTPSLYAARFLEASIGLPERSLSTDDIPLEIVKELAAVMRGARPKDSTRPSLEERVMEFSEDLERTALESQGFFVRKARWPDAARFAVALTHDVDNIERPAEHIERIADRFSKADYSKWKRGELSLYDNVGLVAEKEKSEGFRSSFYYLSANYPLSKVKGEARRLKAAGWDIGLHGDFGTHDSMEKMAQAVDGIGKGLGFRPRSLREHFLKFDFTESWQIMEEAGFDYDSSVGNNDTLGFKLGLATPFHPPDDEWKPMRLLELPLSLMDTTLWGYLKKPEDEGYRDVGRMMKMVEGVEGLFTLLWHPESARMRGGRTYWKVLRDLGRRKGVFVGSGADISRWWRAREVPFKTNGKRVTVAKAPEGFVLLVKAKRGVGVEVEGARSKLEVVD